MELNLTIAGVTKTVECRDLYGDETRVMTVANVALFQKRAGTKLWPERVTFWKQADGSYRAMMTTTILNRSGYRAVAWNEEQFKNRSVHNSAAG